MATKQREVLRMDLAGDLKRILRQKADVMEQRTGDRISVASIARRLLLRAASDRRICRQAGVP